MLHDAVSSSGLFFFSLYRIFALHGLRNRRARFLGSHLQQEGNWSLWKEERGEFHILGAEMPSCIMLFFFSFFIRRKTEMEKDHLSLASTDELTKSNALFTSSVLSLLCILLSLSDCLLGV